MHFSHVSAEDSRDRFNLKSDKIANNHFLVYAACVVGELPATDLLSGRQRTFCYADMKK